MLQKLPIGTQVWLKSDTRKLGEVTGRSVRCKDGKVRVMIRWLLPQRSQEFSCLLHLLTTSSPEEDLGLTEYDARKHRDRFNEFWDELTDEQRYHIFRKAQSDKVPVATLAWSIRNAAIKRFREKAEKDDQAQKSEARTDKLGGCGEGVDAKGS